MACIFGACFGSKSRDPSKKEDWRIFSLKELQAATNNFNYDNKIGEGGFGSVYWGQLWDGSQTEIPAGGRTLITICDSMFSEGGFKAIISKK